MSRGGTGSATSIHRIDGTRIWSGRPDLFAGALALTLLAAALALFAQTDPPALVHGTGSDARQAYGKLPLSFIPNKGQTDAEVRYYAQGSGYSFYFTPHKAVIALTKGERGHALELRFLGANPNARLEATRQQTGTVNYFSGKERHTGIATYGRVVYRDLWPGIDMMFKGQGGKLEYEFLIRPGADPQEIRLAYAGADRISPKTGNLQIKTGVGVLEDSRPLSFQRVGGRKIGITSRFTLLGRRGAYGFHVGTYDRRRSLVIDPGLAYSTYLGGNDFDGTDGIAVNGAGSAYVVGDTSSPDFPTTPGAYETVPGNNDVFVTKLNPSGTAAVYSTLLGGTASTFASGGDIAVDSAGSAYVTGYTSSQDFPSTPGAYDTSLGGTADNFVTKLSPDGGTLTYSTLLGGSANESQIIAIALDSQRNAYLTGITFSNDFPVTADAYDTSFNGPGLDAFVTKLNSSGSNVTYSTYIGGTGPREFAYDIDVDADGNAYTIGTTESADFPTTPGAYDTTFAGSGPFAGDTYVAKLNTAGSALAYSTYLGGTSFDDGYGIAVDAQGNAYVAGRTFSADFPTTSGAYDSTLGGNDGFVAKLNSTGSGLSYSTLLGGNAGIEGSGPSDGAFAIALDGHGNAYVSGFTATTDFPTTPDAYDRTQNGGDAFSTKLSPTGSSVLYSTYLGGSSAEGVGPEFWGIAVDELGDVYMTAATQSTDFTTTSGAFDETDNGSFGDWDAFVTKLDIGLGPPANLTLSPKTATNTVDSRHCVTATVTDASGSPTSDIAVVFTVSAINRAGGTRTTDPNGQATFCYTGELFGTDEITVFADTDSSGTQDAGEPADSATKQWLLPAQSCRATITNSGRIVAQNGDSAIFRGQAKSNPSDVRGSELYLDRGPTQRLTLRSLELLAITCDPDQNRATIFGRAAIDGSGSFAFRIDLQDNGEPGAGRDTYRILIESGYDSGEQVLRSGNVRLRLR